MRSEGQANDRPIAAKQIVIGDFDVSGLTIDPRTGKVGGQWKPLRDGAADHLDFQTVAELCWCCGIEMLKSGSKFSLIFCAECQKRVQDLNRRAGGLIIPVGRHSFMNQGPWLSGGETRDPAKVASFAKGMVGLFAGIARLSEWADESVRRNCASTGLSRSQPIPIALYLEAVATLSRQVAFDGMCKWWLA